MKGFILVRVEIFMGKVLGIQKNGFVGRLYRFQAR